MIDIGADLQRAFDEGYEKGKAEERRWWTEFCANCKDGDRAKGEWTNAGFLTVCCSNCGSQFHELEAVNYCPACGAEMECDDDDYDYERAVEMAEHERLYEPTYNPEDGSM